jgi:hydrophobic/amphiphilic exporter-1 (mainly G- bacteria), HAE1 family
MMRTILRWCVGNPAAMNLMMIGAFLVGIVAVFGMRREVFPNFDLEIVLISVPYPGASPQEVEQGVCQKIEEAVRSVEGIKQMTSVSRESSGFVICELEAKADVTKALSEIRSNVDRIPSFPELTEDPIVQQITFRTPAIRVGVIADASTASESDLRLREVAEEVRSELIALGSVSQATIRGELPYQIDVELSEETLRKYGLTLKGIADIIRRENIEIPGGKIQTPSEALLLRGRNKGLRGSDIAKLPLMTSPEGTVLTVSDLGDVYDGFEDTASFQRVDGSPALLISVDRTKTEDLIRIVDDVKAYAAKKVMPPGYHLKLWQDTSIDVRERLELLTEDGLQGLVLVFIVLAVFLEFRLAYWVATGIPFAILATCALLFATGETLNMLTLFSFLLALGILVDDAIVISENFHVHREMGKSLQQAAIDATVEVAPSVTVGVLCCVIAFVPLFFVSGVMGKFIACMPFTVIAMLLISLAEGLTILPAHLGHDGVLKEMAGIVGGIRRSILKWNGAILTALGLYFGLVLFSIAIEFLPTALRNRAGIKEAFDILTIVRPSFSSFNPVQLFSIAFLLFLGALVSEQAFLCMHSLFHFVKLAFDQVNKLADLFVDFSVQRIYLPLLQVAMRNIPTVIAIEFAILTITATALSAGLVKRTVFPQLDGRAIEAKITFPDGTPAAITDAAVRQVAEAMSRLDEKLSTPGKPLVHVMHESVGQFSGAGMPGAQERDSGEFVGSVFAELAGAEDRSLTSMQIVDLWREEAGKIIGAESVVFGAQSMGPGGKDVEFKLVAEETHWRELEDAATKILAQLGTYSSVADEGDDNYEGKWEYQIKVNEKARSMGVSTADLAETIRSAYYGEEVMRLQRGRHEVKLMVRYPRNERNNLVSLDRLRIRGTDGLERPISELADIQIVRGYSEIQRLDQLRAITIAADVLEGGNANEIVTDLQTKFMPTIFKDHPNVKVRWEGQKEQDIESMSSLGLGALVAVIAMYLLLVFQLESLLQPLIILYVIPFAAAGAVWGHYVMGIDLTLFGVFGLVALMGMVVNDSIVLLDFINARLKDYPDEPLIEAIMEGGRRRIRPVALNTVTGVIGIVPLLADHSFQAQALIPMGVSLVFGLSAATILGLFIVPTSYYLLAQVIPPTRGRHAEHYVETRENENFTAGQLPVSLNGSANGNGNGHAHDNGAAKPNPVATEVLAE